MMARALRLGSVAPNFNADTTHGLIRFSEWARGSWVVFFSHPGGFTPVCTTELAEVARLDKEWKTRNVKVIGISANSTQSHRDHVKDIEEIAGCKAEFPLIGDKSRHVTRLYSLLDEADATNIDETGAPLTVRTVLVLDPKRVIRLMLTYPASTGRCFPEVLRVIDSLQMSDSQKVITPVNWQRGEPVIIHPSVSDEEAEALFPGYTTPSATAHYLRYTTAAQAEAFL